MSQESKVLLAMGSLLAAVFAGILCLHVFVSYNEAQAFRRLTGKEVSTWDAMFVELRVQEPAKGANDGP